MLEQKLQVDPPTSIWVLVGKIVNMWQFKDC